MPDALSDISRRPHHYPHQTPDDVVHAIKKLKEKRPAWGPKKLLYALEKKYPHFTKYPAVSTISVILKRHGLSSKYRRRLKRYHPGRPMTVIKYPNHVWTVDFKGHFKTGDGLYCYPLTAADGDSRFLLSCEGMLSPSHEPVRAVFKGLFKKYGLPERIRSDNGNPFASIALGRLSRLSVWWIKLGIIPELIEPGCPQQNGRHERMHRTLKYDTTIPPAKDLIRQQERFNIFQEDYNYERPHESLGMRPPADVYKPSDRKMPDAVPKITYPAHYEVRRVSNNSGIRWNKNWVNVSHVLAGEYVGLEEIDLGIWDVYFGPVWLGRLNEKIMKIEDENGKLEREARHKKV